MKPFVPDDYLRAAVATWHGSLTDPRNAAMKLFGETGELVDDLAKAMYKPGYKLSREQAMEEAGDAWYYWRILAVGNGLRFEWGAVTPTDSRQTVQYALAEMGQAAGNIFHLAEVNGAVLDIDLLRWVRWFMVLLGQLGLSLDEVHQFNVEKLAGADNHGWKPQEG
jgi:hypothetical protein